MAKSTRTALAPVEHITRTILVLRGHKVLLDIQHAAPFGVETRVLLQAIGSASLMTS